MTSEILHNGLLTKINARKMRGEQRNAVPMAKVAPGQSANSGVCVDSEAMEVDSETMVETNNQG